MTIRFLFYATVNALVILAASIKVHLPLEKKLASAYSLR